MMIRGIAPQLLLLLLLVAPLVKALMEEPIPVKINNRVGAPIEVIWIDEWEDRVVNMGPPIAPEKRAHLTSFRGHKFMIRLPQDTRGDMQATEVYFRKSPMEESISIYYDGYNKKLVLMDDFPAEEGPRPSFASTNKPALPPHADMQKSVRAAAEDCQHLKQEGASDDFAECMATNIMHEVEHLSESKATVSKYQNLVSSRLRNYTCVDDDMQTTPPLYSYPLTLPDVRDPNKTYTYDTKVLFDQDHAKIWMVENFVTDEECDTIMNFGRPRLARATVAAEDGTSVISESRKANQASYNLHRKQPADDPLWSLYNRAMEMINTHAGYTLETSGQEDFTIIQYDPNDQYAPHCDGQCDGEQHIAKGRVATAVLYCKAADRGGATAFTKADVFVKGKKGAATFFTYKGPDGRTDEGLTEHSGCPVLEGEKFITAIWFRDGVTAKDPWTKYDPCGVPILH